MAEHELPDRSALAPRLLLGLLAAAGIAVLTLGGDPKRLLSALAAEQAFVHDLIASWSFLAGLAFVAGYASLMTVLWIPPWLCTVIGGLLFGLWLGAAYAVAGATLGAIGVFLLARSGIGNLARRAGPFLHRLEAKFRANAFSYVLMLRLVPVMPFAVVNIVAAALRVRLPSFVLATVLGILPSTLIYASLGVSLGSLAASQEMPTAGMLLRPGVLLPLLGLAVLALVPVAYGWWRGRGDE